MAVPAAPAHNVTRVVVVDEAAKARLLKLAVVWQHTYQHMLGAASTIPGTATALQVEWRPCTDTSCEVVMTGGTDAVNRATAALTDDITSMVVPVVKVEPSKLRESGDTLGSHTLFMERLQHLCRLVRSGCTTDRPAAPADSQDFVDVFVDSNVYDLPVVMTCPGRWNAAKALQHVLAEDSAAALVDRVLFPEQAAGSVRPYTVDATVVFRADAPVLARRQLVQGMLMKYKRYEKKLCRPGFALQSPSSTSATALYCNVHISALGKDQAVVDMGVRQVREAAL